MFIIYTVRNILITIYLVILRCTAAENREEVHHKTAGSTPVKSQTRLTSLTRILGYVQ